MNLAKPLLLAVGCALLWTVPSAGADDEARRNALREDAAAYAADFSVDLDEAVRRLELQHVIGDLDGVLAEGEKASYAGLWIEHEPAYRMVIAFTDNVPGREAALRLEGRLASRQYRRLAQVLELRSARWSLAELEAAQATADALVDSLGLTSESSINVPENRVELRIRDAQALSAALAGRRTVLPPAVNAVEVSGFIVPEQLTIRGGRPFFGCTSGFNVRRTNGELGTTSAAHCDNTLFYEGTTVLPFRGEDLSGNQDVQWHSGVCGAVITNQFDTGIGIRNCTGTRTRSTQAIGSYVCKHGRTTGYTCGNILSKSVRPSHVASASATFVLVRGTGNLSEGGDSGGPWFVETLAYGIHSGSPSDTPNDAVYMPVEYTSSLNAFVLTFNPGTGGALDVTLSCSGNTRGSLQVTCQAVTTGGTPPFTYNWTYSGMAPSWSGGGAFAYAYYFGSGCPSGGVNFFTVNVTDACGQTDFASIGSLPCF